MTLQDASDAFVAGWTATRRLTGPYEAIPQGEATLAHDPTGKRMSELVCVDLAPTRAVELYPKEQRGAICAIYSPSEDLHARKKAFRALGWRLLRTEPMFVHHLRDLPLTDPRIARASSPEHVARICKAAKMRPASMGIDDEDDATIRLYEASVDGQNVGWVRSIRAGQQDAWVSSLNVHEEFRRQGYGAGLMAALLRDDARLGRRASVLLASHTGALLYPRLGYERLGTLMFLMREKTG
ncbi:N-acetyltransferase [bacterium]|nr:MAG: N-acetyltransferase [bacterium]